MKKKTKRRMRVTETRGISHAHELFIDALSSGLFFFFLIFLQPEKDRDTTRMPSGGGGGLLMLFYSYTGPRHSSICFGNSNSNFSCFKTYQV